MSDRVGDGVTEGSGGPIRRRKLLAAVGAAGTGGLAGCSSTDIGDAVDGDDSDDGSDGDDGTTEDVACTDVTNGYQRKDVGERPFVFDFEYPSVFGELEFVQAGAVVLYNDSVTSGDTTIDIEIQQVTDPDESIGAAPDGSGGVTTTFNGEEVEFFGVSSGSELLWAGDLPYQLDGQRETFATVVSLSTGGEGSNACGDALRAAAERIVTSMELNPDTTLGSGGGGGGGDGTDEDDGTSGDLACTDVTNGYQRKDVGERPFVFDFEYPSLFEELEFVQATSVVLYRDSRTSGDTTLEIELQQVTDPEESVGETPDGSVGVTTTFNGEEVEFAGLSDGSSVFWVGDLPYQLDGQRETFATVVSLSTSTEGSNACGDALRAAAERVVTSMELNPETTLGS